LPLACFVLKARRMRKPKPRPYKIPPFSSALFPHEDFPAWKSIACVFDAIGEALRRPPVRTNLEKVQVPLIEAAERIVVIASGGLRPHRWHRRVCKAIEFLDRGFAEVMRAVDAGALTMVEGDCLLDGIAECRVHLLRAIDVAPIPDDIRQQLPESPPLRVLH